MASIGDLVARLTMDNRQFAAGAKQAQSITQGMVSSITSTIGPLAATIAGAFAVKSMISAAREQDVAQKKLAAVLLTTGGAAGVTVGEIAKLGGQLQAVAGIGDEVTISAAAMLATFKSIKGDNFKAVLKVAADMVPIIGGDLTSAVRLVGRAMDSPAEGLSRLGRVGVSFTATQEAMIKKMAAAGDAMGAQKMILTELESKFKGTAAAAADPFKLLMLSISDIGENIGTGLLPLLDSLARKSAAWLEPLNAMLANSSSQIGFYASRLTAVAVGFTAIKIASMAYAAAQRLATISAITFQAVMNPASLIKIAIGIGAAVATVVLMDQAMASVARDAPAAAAGAAALAKGMDGVGVAAGKAAITVGTWASDAGKAVRDLEIKLITSGDAAAEARFRVAATASPAMLGMYDRLTEQVGRMTERQKAAAEAARAQAQAQQEAISKNQEWAKSSQELSDQIAVVTGAMTKLRAATRAGERRGLTLDQAFDLAFKQQQLDDLQKKAAAKGKADQLRAATPQTSRATLAGTSEAASIALRGVGGDTGRNQLQVAKQQLAVQKQQLTATKANKPPAIVAAKL